MPGVCAVGEIVHIWRRGVRDDQLCGCGAAFRECPFWSRVGEVAFGGWDRLDLEEVLRLERQVDRNRYVPLMVLARRGRYAERLGRYLPYLERLYAAIREVSGADVIVDSTKHASYAYLLRRLRNVDLRVAHLVRDSRGVAFSWTKEVRKPEVVREEAYMPRYHPFRMGFRWVAYNGLFNLLRVLGARSRFVRYEDLIRAPQAAVERILSLAGADGADLGFLGEHHVDLEATHSVAGNPMRFKVGRVDLRLDEEWRRSMRRAHRAIVSVVTAPLMFLYGYRRRDDGER